MTAFQAVVLIVFGVAILAGLLFFATYRAGSKQTIGNVTVWGTFDYATVINILGKYTNADARFQHIQYVQKDPATFDADLADALAAGNGPDLFFLPQNLLYKELDKLYPYPYARYPDKTFRDTYIDEAQLFLMPQGIAALPVVVDPMVLYWNKDLLSKYGYATPPTRWDQTIDMGQKLTIADSSGAITQSGIALGEAANVPYVKDIIDMLTQQAGGAIVARNDTGVLRATFDSATSNAAEKPSVSAVRFYTSFANPNEINYSWNRALPNARDAFTQGIVGLYLGYASEYDAITEGNPNLRFDVAAMPQIATTSRFVTAGRLYGLAIPRVSVHIADAEVVATLLSSPQLSGDFAAAFGMAPTRRSLLSGQADGVAQIANKMALIASSWIDPDPMKTTAILTAMVQDITSGASSGSRLTTAVSRASQSIQALLQ